MLENFKYPICENILLLQGPVGYFFDKFRKYLLKNGAKKVLKVNFNYGDEFFNSHDDVISFDKPFHELSEFYSNIIDKHNINAVYLFGDCRPIHKFAIEVFKRKNIDIYVFEEGYIRPNYITIEKNGVNNFSSLPRDIRKISKLTKHNSKISHLNHGYGFFRFMAVYAFIYFIMMRFGNYKYPFYKHHKSFYFCDLFLWLVSYLRKPFYRLRDKIRQKSFLSSSKPFFFAPLQMFNDFQIHEHSDYFDIKDFLEDIMVSFARNAPEKYFLVIKHHPFDRGHRHYKSFIFNRAKTLGIKDRIYYFHEGNLPKFLRNAKGTVVINSTVGLSSLFHKTAVKVMGKAFYDIGGLTYQGKLKDFWRSNAKVNQDNYHIYRNFIIQETQIQGSFYDKDFFNNNIA